MWETSQIWRSVAATFLSHTKGVDATGSNLTGTLRDYFGYKRIPQAEVTIVSEANCQAPVVLWSDWNGRFAVSNLAPDYYDFRVKATKGKT